MNRPPLEVADIVRVHGKGFIQSSGRWIHWSHCKVLRAIARCRTAVLGGHRDLKQDRFCELTDVRKNRV